MRTTIELPDDLLARAKSKAALSGISLRQFFIDAVEQKLAAQPVKSHRPLPVVGGPGGPRIDVLTPEQIDEAMFG